MEALKQLLEQVRTARDGAHQLTTSPDIPDRLCGELHDAYNALGDIVGTFELELEDA